MAQSQHVPGSARCMYIVCSDNSNMLIIFQHAENAQQVFSLEQESTLHLAIPALEALHRAWSSRAECPKYERFVPALNAACAKVDEYYDKTRHSAAFIMAMSKQLFSSLVMMLILLLVLNPR